MKISPARMLHMAVLQAFLGIACIIGTLSHATEVYGPEDATAIKSLLASKAGPAGNFGSSLEDAFYGVGTLTLLGAKEELQSKALCSVAAAELNSEGVSVAQAFQAAHLVGVGRCSDAGSKAKAEKVAVAALEAEVSDTRTAYQALSTLASLGKSASQKATRNALLPIQKLKASNGLLRLARKGPGSLTATAYGYLAIAQAKEVGSIGKDIMPAVEELLSGIPQVLEAASKRVAVPEGGSLLEAASRLVQGLEATCSEECTLDAQQLGALAKLFMRAKAVGSVEDAYYLLAGLTALTTTGSLPKPLALELQTPAVPLAKAEVVVLARDFVGNPASPAGLKGSLKGDGGKKAPAGDLSFASQGKGVYSASLRGLDLGLGTYQLTVTAHGEGSKIAAETFPLTLTGSVDIGPATVSVKNLEASSEKNKSQLQYPEKLSAALSLDHRSQLKVLFTVKASDGKPFTAQQAFVILKSQSGTIMVAAKPGKSSTSDYSATITPDTIAKQISTQAGTFEVTLSVGDEALEEAVVWTLGSATVAPALGESDAQRTSPVLSAAQKDAAPKPEILHMFRTPDKRPPAVLSLFFAAAAVAVPAAFLLLRLYQLGINLKKGFPSTGAASTATLAFHAGIASILGLYTVFWLRLTLIDTLLPLAGLSIFTFLAGYKALSYQAREEAGKHAGNSVALKKD